MSDLLSSLPKMIQSEETWRRSINYHPFNIEVVRAEGIYYYDADGNAYMDASGGPLAINIGHRDPRMVEAMKRQLDAFYYVHPYLANRPRAEYANLLAEKTPGDLNNLFMVSGGSEAVETAIKFARHYQFSLGNTTKRKIIGCYGSYHGMSLATMGVSGNPGFMPHYHGMMPDWPHFHQYSDFNRPAGVSREQWGVECALNLEKLFYFENPDSIAAFISTPVGSGSDYGTIPPASYWREIRRICDEHNVILIADEVVTGFGRTGKWFAMEHFDVVPDMMTIGKGMTGCAAPAGGVLLSDKVAAPFQKEGEYLIHVFTFQGHPLTVAAAHATINIIDEDNLVERSARLGDVLHGYREQLLAHPTVSDVRGEGLFLVMELVENKETREYFPPEKDAEHLFQAIALKNGLVFYSTLYGPRRASVVKRGLPMWVLPPFEITEEQLAELMEKLDKTLTEWESHLNV